MASAFQFGYGAPENFSDWAKYAGLDRKTGTFVPRSDGGIPPPKDMSEMFAQQLAPIKQSYQTATTNIGNAMTQFGQGNFVQGMNAVRGAAVPGQTAGAAPAIMGGPPPINPYSYNYED